MSRKAAAVSFLKLASGGQVEEAYASFVAPRFIHHNQHFAGDRDSLKAAMAEAHARSPNERIEVKQVFEDGDVVVTLSRVVRKDRTQPDVAVVHIFRFEGDKVVELWDLGQPVIPDSPNENGAF